MTDKVSDIQISNTPLIKVKQWSKESYYINPKYLNIVEGSEMIQSRSLAGYGDASISTDFQNVSTDPLKAPQLSDIESVTKSLYYDPATKKARAKIVIKIRNNCPDPIIGIDARVAIAASDGGLG